MNKIKKISHVYSMPDTGFRQRGVWQSGYRMFIYKYLILFSKENTNANVIIILNITFREFVIVVKNSTNQI